MSLRRRQFLAFVGAMAGTTFATRAQRTAQSHRIGVLAQDLQPGLMAAFRDELQKLGYLEGPGLVIELRNAAGQNERLPALANELSELGVDVIVAVNTPAAQAAQRVTRTIPIVIMRVADPVKSGLVASLARPGGNVTGLSFMPDALGPKGVELLHNILPGIGTMAALYRGDNKGAVVIVDEVVRKGEQLGLRFVRIPVNSDSSEAYQSVFAAAHEARCEALFVMDDGTITADREEILALATAQKLPVVSIYKDFAKAGGLISYGPNLDIVYRRAAHFIDKLFKGQRAGDLPVEQPVIFDLAINLRTAKALGIAVPQSVLVRADEVIE
jgi:putative tryptophan/tyrosine transport system substrate-binding protein